ncbi:MAG: hypothetical protein P8J34_04110 [Flavobacteriales bacterium]|jgi:hypothetical protein|nr:hypothetical protein [Flavobacteriales bacterium]
MKKLMSIFAACLFVFALASCGAEGDASGSGSDASGSEEAASAEAASE